MTVITWIAYAVVSMIGLAIAGGVLVFIASLSAVIGGVVLVLFIAAFIFYAIKSCFSRS